MAGMMALPIEMESNLPARTAHLTTKEEQMTADQTKTQRWLE
eukprot:CAMPEP_0113406050 /NCGR_PEP_ID=MMETSP0013_2-20120614/19293_1 /TAXON_ID=2843 ORGANISM="Skeletonema costatum, Strain 1716" /NCGR_SAMPLE_ID=MMETSP0013_2 /ASSEMBLY_ACC=CAM_ASM_000158 /LENGTH=41 /DNA_ID=CAMNT_0000291847 /DNA_START=45 /DNA_END=170 /DNA_ORIENTATION=+ /assembly_acc=CAM_ASM_000158